MTNCISNQLLHGLRDQPNGELHRLVRRATIQIDFARAFASLPNQNSAGWNEKIENAERILEKLDPSAGLSGLTEAVAAVEKELAEIGQAAKTYRIHCVSHGHIDMNWMWSWQETVSTTHDTFASVLSLMRQYPDLTYSQSQASVYALIEKYHPKMFEEIKQRVKEGRWEVTAAHWVEGDKNISAGESLCRHILYTRDYFQEKFGMTPEDEPVDWEPDTFGHAITVPTFAKQGAIKYYYCCRPGGGFDHAMIGEPRPRLFYWQAPDGARVLVNRESTWYNSYVNIGENIALPLVDFANETGLHEWLNVFGIGNHGGGPTRTELEYFEELKSWPIYPQLVYSTTKRFFETIEGELTAHPELQLPVIDHELNFEFTGCYTSQSLIKQANRFGENFLLEAETLAALSARLFDQPYPQKPLREAWLKVLFNQFHDILPGSGVRQTREHAMAEFQEVGAITGAIKRESIDTFADHINTISLLPDTWAGNEERTQAGTPNYGTGFESAAGSGASYSGLSESGGLGRRFRPVVVFNTCAWTRTERVQVSLFDSGFDPGQTVVLCDDGTVLPTLYLGPTPAPHLGPGAEAWGHTRLIFAFDAADIPPLGYRTYLICERGSLPREVTYAGGRGVEAHLYNRFKTPFLDFQVDREQSGVVSLTDLRSGARLTPEGSALPMGAFQYVLEQHRGMTAWALGREVDPPVILKSTGLHVLGPVFNQGNNTANGTVPSCQARQILKVPGTNSIVSLLLTIHALEPRLDFTAVVDWREIGTPDRGIPGLIVSIPLALTSITSRYEVPFGSIERTLTGGEEVPTLRYAHIEGTAKNADGQDVFAGITLVQDCKYGHSISGNDRDGYVLNMRIVRSSFDPDPTPEVAITTVRYSLFFHDKPADPATLTRLGASWNHPLLAAPVGVHAGETATSQSFARVQTPNVVLTALKKAEGSEGLVLRLAELNGEATEAVVELSPEITKGFTTATVVDLMERPVQKTAQWQGNTLRVPVDAHDFVTVVVH